MSKYQLITDLCESKVFRSRQAIDRFSQSDKENLLYGVLLSTIALSLDTKTSGWAKEYASKTAAFSNFSYFRPSATDLYVLLHIAELGQQENNMVRLLRRIANGTVTRSEIQQVLLRLERMFPSINARLRTARRTVAAWDTTSPSSRKMAVQNLILTIRLISRRAEVLPYLKVLKGGPRGSFGKSSTLKKAAALAGIGLAGLALGYKTYNPNKRTRIISRARESIRFNVSSMLVEDRATQLSYLVQKLPEHPAVEKVLSVNYIADGISAFVRTTDGNAYEFEIRPARFSKGHDDARGLAQRNKERLEKLEARITEALVGLEPGETQDCRSCGGSGKYYDDVCWTCLGKGILDHDGNQVDDDITEEVDNPLAKYGIHEISDVIDSWEEYGTQMYNVTAPEHGSSGTFTDYDHAREIAKEWFPFLKDDYEESFTEGQEIWEYKVVEVDEDAE